MGELWLYPVEADLLRYSPIVLARLSIKVDSITILECDSFWSRFGCHERLEATEIALVLTVGEDEVVEWLADILILFFNVLVNWSPTILRGSIGKARHSTHPVSLSL